MKITVTVKDIFEKGCWDQFCKLKCISAWAVNEGQVKDNEVFYLTEDGAKELKFVRINHC